MSKMYLEVPCHYSTNVCVCKMKYEPDTLGNPVLLCPKHLLLLFYEWVSELDPWVRFVEVALYNNSAYLLPVVTEAVI